MLVASMNFDLIVATSIGDSIITNRMLKGCLVMIEYRGILVNSVALICFGKGMTFYILSQLRFRFKGKDVDRPMHMISTFQVSSLL